MKKKLFALAMLLVCLLLVSCTKETTALRAKKSSFYLALDGSVNIEDYLVKEGKGKLNYSIENPDVLQLDGTTLRGIAVGKGAVIAESDGFIVRIDVEVVDTKKVSVNVLDGRIRYDGSWHLPTVVGKLPEGSYVRFYSGEELFNGAVEAGRYELTAEVVVPEPYYVEYVKKDCVYIVEPVQFDLTGIYFTSSTYTYDGTEKSIYLTGGTLPKGVTVRYENNVGIEAGTYRATAYFSVPDDKNYVPLQPMTADLIIRQKFINVETLGFSSATYQYDGAGHSVLFEQTMEGMEIEYYTYRNNVRVPLEDDYVFVDSGEYPVYAALTLDPELYRNYTFYADGLVNFSVKGGKFVSDADTDACAVLTVRKSGFYNDYRWNLTDPTGSAVLSVPYGRAINIGEEGGYSLRLTGSSHGTNGEFPQGATVVYSSPMLKNAKGNFNSGTYTVTASFVMPEGSTKNYSPLADLYYSLTITKGTIDVSSLSFSADPAEVEYDGTVYDFAVDSSAMADFDSILRVDYTRRKNGLKMSASDFIGAPAEYDVIADFTVVGDDKDNYAAPASMSIHFVINKKKIAVDVTFESVVTTYNGAAHLMAIEGNLPEDVSVTYTCGRQTGLTSVAFTDAGTYNVIAVFKYKNWLSDKFIITDQSGKAYPKMISDDGKEFYGKDASLTIAKAMKELTDEIKAAYVQSSIPVYSEDLTVGDITLTGNENGYVRYENAEEKIRLIGSNASEHTAWFTLSLIYNEDVDNYYDASFALTGKVYQKEIDMSGVTVPDQFVAYTNKTVVPYIRCDAEERELLTAVVAAKEGTDLVSVGKHRSSVTLELKAEKAAGYYLSGNVEYDNVDLYIYNAAQYTYGVGTTSLAEYKGSDRNVSVPEGTSGIQRNAFASAAYVETLALPDSVVTIANDALYGAFSLTELSLPSYFSLKPIFRNQIPVSLNTVTVRSCSSIPDNAFSGLMNLKKVVFSTAVDTVGEYAFADCTSLQEVSFVGVPDYGQNAFSGCRSLVSLTVKEFSSPSYYFGTRGVSGYTNFSLTTLTITQATAVADEAFRGLTTLETIVLPTGVTAIGKRAFYDVKGSVDLSSAAFSSLGEYAFTGFKGTLVLPGGLVALASNSFADCTAATLVFSKNVTSIGANAFSGCTSAIVFANDSVMTSIGASAFRGYAGSTLSLPATVTALGAYAFENSSVVSFEVPAAMTIGVGCFKNSKSLASVTIRCSNVPEEAFYGCESLETINFYNVTTIGDNAFYGCAALTRLILPNTVTAIGTTAFSGCLLTDVTMLAENPPVLAKQGVFPTDRVIRFVVPAIGYIEYVTYLRNVGCDMGKITVNGRSPG